jgi:LuxR family maltose regulon positive regulatory protein
MASERGGGGAGGARVHQPITSLLAAPCALALYEIDRLDEAGELLDRHEPLLGALYSPSSRTLWYQLRARLHSLDDNLEQHAATLRDGVAYARQHGIEWMANAILWEGVAGDLRHGQHESARQKAVPLLAGLDLERSTPWITVSDEVFGAHIGAIRYFAQTGATALALQLVQPRIAWDEAKGRRLRLAKLRVLQAMALSAGGQREPAHAAMDQALALGRECGLVRTFLDEGPPCAALLRELDQRAPEETGTPLDAYRRHLLQAFAREAGLEPPAVAASGAGGSPGSGALTARELQIIDRLALGHSNLFVSQQLFLSPNTIKWHLSQIYSKLGVRNRTQAVRAAQQQGLISQVIAAG